MQRRRTMMRFVAGLIIGVILGTTLVMLAQEPAVTIKNGPLEGWSVVRDDETLLCEDPIVFVRARQIECP